MSARKPTAREVNPRLGQITITPTPLGFYVRVEIPADDPESLLSFREYAWVPFSFSWAKSKGMRLAGKIAREKRRLAGKVTIEIGIDEVTP